MAHTSKTLELSDNWDLIVSPDGNIKIVQGAQAIAQNCANEIRLWTGDAYFQQNNGIEWKEVQLAKKMDKSVLRSVIREACLLVDGVQRVTDVTIDGLNTDTRELTGSITVLTTEGENVSVSF